MDKKIHPQLQHYDPWFGEAVRAEIEQTVRTLTIASAGRQIHLDIYPLPEDSTARGTIVFSHGIGGYARLLSPFAIGLMQRGFNVICPDLMGYGFNEGTKGDWTWKAFIQNLHDALDYAKLWLPGRLFLAGASLGGTLAYHAACTRSDLSAVACYCLFDYRDERFIQEVSQFKQLISITKPFLKLSARLLPHLSLPAEWVVSYEHIADDAAFVRLLRRDPLAGNRISLQAVSSMMSAAPAVEYEDFRLPTVVIQPSADRMIPAKWSELYYERLGGEKKYVDIPDCGHWTLYPHQVDQAVAAMADWFESYSELTEVMHFRGAAEKSPSGT